MEIKNIIKPIIKLSKSVKITFFMKNRHRTAFFILNQSLPPKVKELFDKWIALT